MIPSILAGLFLALAPLPDRPRDQFADPLPPGAIARMGTIRLRSPDEIEGVTISPDGKTLITDSRAGLKVWDARTGHVLREIEFLSFPDEQFPKRQRYEGSVAVAFSADSRKLHVLTYGGFLRVCDLDTGRWSEPVARTEKPTDPVRLSSRDVWGHASPDGTHFAYVLHLSSRAEDENSNRVEVFALDKGKPVLVLKGKEFGEPGGYVRFSRDNKRVAVRLNNGTLRIWDVASGNVIATTPQIEKDLLNFEFSPDGKALAAAYSTEKERRFVGPVMTLVMWDAATGKEQIRREKWEGFVVGFTQDGKRLLSVTREDVVVTDTQTWNTIARLGGHKRSEFPHVFLSADTRRLVTAGGRDHSMISWDLETLKPALDFDAPRGPVAVLAFSPDGQTLVSGTHQEQSCWLWDVRTGKRKHALAIKDWGQTYDAVFTPDGKSVLVGSGSGGTGSGKDWKARQWNVMDGKLVREFTGHDSGAQRIAVAPDGKRFATHEAGKTVRTWEIDSGKLHSEHVWSYWQFAGFGYSKAGELIGVAPEKENVQACDLLTGKTLNSWKTEGRCHVLGLSPDTKLIAALEENNDPRRTGFERWVIRDRTTGAIISRLPIATPSYSNPVAFSHDNKTIALGVRRHGPSPDDAVQLFEVATGNLIRTIEGHRGRVSTLAFSPDGKKLATGGWDTTVLVWDLTSKP